MIKLPSQQFEYTLVWSGDPSLNLPSDKDARTKALDVARETGQWATLMNSGESPTLFHVRPITGALLDWYTGEVARRQLSMKESCAFALRVALRRVEGFGQHEVKTERAGKDREFTIATIDIINALYDVEGVGRDIVEEIGELIMIRAYGGLAPKS